MKERTISAIKQGTVIDHIPANYTFKVAEILGFDKIAKRVIIASNLESNKMGKKGIIKIEDVYLNQLGVQKIALIASNATLSVIKDYKVTEKTKLKRPNLIKSIIKCSNPNCITNKEEVVTQFTIESENPITVRCRHCERPITKEDMRLL